jgi:predicted NBD/HSP70 family sugar kinase
MGTYNKLSLLSDRCKYIFNIIQKDGPITKSELINKTEMKLTTLNRDIKVLTDNDIVVETAVAESTGGRKPVLYDINPCEFYCIGIDISRTYTQIIITNLKIKIVGEKKLNSLYNIDEMAEIIPECIGNLCKSIQIDKSMIIGIGIGIVGGYAIQALQDKLSNEFEVPVYIDNGANTAVLGEYFFGAGKGKKNIAYINCGVGIRTGVISSGVLIRTINNYEDAFAHMIVDINGDPCACGNYGCVESYASISEITKKFISEAKKYESVCLNKDLNQIDYMHVCSLAENKNNIAVNILIDAAVHFGIGLSNYIRLFNPQLIILSGPLVQHSQFFYDECTKIALEKCHLNSIDFNRGGYFRNKSIAVGASVMAIERLIN